MYVQINHKLLDDLSVLRCAKLLGIHQNEVIGILSRIWRFAMVHYPSGILSGVSSTELAEISMFQIDESCTNCTADFFLDALIENNFLSPEMKLAGWEKNSGELFIRRGHTRERVARHRAQKEDLST